MNDGGSTPEAIRPMLAGKGGLALLLFFYLAQGVAFSVIVPLWEPPDEERHFVYVKYLADNLSLPPLSYELSENPVTLAFHPPLYHALVAPLAAGYSEENPLLDIRRTEDGGKRVFDYSVKGTRFPYSGLPLRAHLMRLVSLALGGVAVVCAWLIGKEVFESERWVAFTAAALVGLNPQFIFISASVNDQALSSALGAVSLFLMVRVMKNGPRLHLTFYLGLVLGALALTSTSFVLLVLAMLAALLASGAGMKKAFQHFASALVIAFVTSGWWYVRNLVLHNDPFLWRIHREVFGAAFLRDSPMGTIEFMNLLRLLHRSFWGVFGSMNIPLPYPIYWALELFTGISVFGFVRCLTRRRQTLTPGQSRLLLVLLLAVSLFFVSIVRYNFTFVSAQGRYMFVVLPAIGLLGAAGFVKGLDRRPGLTAAFVFSVLLALDVVSFFLVIGPAYR